MTPTDTIGPDIRLYRGDCLAVLPMLAPGSVDAVVTDPPYGLEFMGKEWDSFPLRDRGERLTGSGNSTTARGFGGNVAYGKSSAALRQFGQWCEIWSAAALRVLKPGGYMLAMGGTRTYHRLACAVEDAGFEIRDCVQEFFESDRRLATFAASLNDEQRGAFEELIAPGQVLSWVYGSGFPKGKGCLKPAYEPILLCRKPGPKVLPLGIDECRVGTEKITTHSRGRNEAFPKRVGETTVAESGRHTPQNNIDPSPRFGRWPANVLHDGSEEVLEAFAAFGERKSGAFDQSSRKAANAIYGAFNGYSDPKQYESSTGTAARFFYCAKADASERWGNHPTVKPLALMRWLVNLVSKPGDTILDPFLGSGSTIEAARGRHCIGIERDEGYYATALKRLRHAAGKADDQLFSVLESGS